jgi:hypothetical protein
MQINSLVGGPERGDGGSYSRVGEPLTVDKEYEAIWKRARLDTNELARLRSEGWPVSQLVAHFGYSRTSIKRELRRLGVKPLSVGSLA